VRGQGKTREDTVGIMNDGGKFRGKLASTLKEWGRKKRKLIK